MSTFRLRLTGIDNATSTELIPLIKEDYDWKNSHTCTIAAVLIIITSVVLIILFHDGYKLSLTVIVVGSILSFLSIGVIIGKIMMIIEVNDRYKNPTYKAAYDAYAAAQKAKQ